MTTQRPAVIELVKTTGPRKGGRRGDTQTYHHARIRAAGNRRVTWWSEDYPRPVRARHAVELLPGFTRWGSGRFVIIGSLVYEVRTVDERRNRP